MSINNNSFDWTIDNLKEVIEQNIAFASEKLTLKMGDLVLIANNTNIDIKVGDKLQLLVVRKTTNIMCKKMTMGINTSHRKNTWVFPVSGFL